MFSRSFSRLSRVKSTDRRSANSHRRTLRLEMLEDRRLLSVTPYVVDSLADNTDLDGVITLREAIEAANTNAIVGDAHAGSASETDVITFDSSLHGGTIMLGGEELVVTDELDIQGPGADLLTIDANQESRVILADHAGELAVSGVTIQKGKPFASYYNHGGGIAAYSTVLTVTDAVITQCEAGTGGGIYCDRPLTIMNSIVSNNATNQRENPGDRLGTGGGIYCSQTLSVTGSTVSDNWAWFDGGGIVCSGFNGSSVTDSVISGNFAGYRGAGVFSSREDLSIVNSVFADNSADSLASYGGAIYSGRTLTVSGSTFSNNLASYYGGAIYNDESGEFTTTECSFVRNSADVGGGISNVGTGTVLSCSFEGNIAGDGYGRGDGGAVHNAAALEIVNSILVGNGALRDGGGVANSGEMNLTNCTVTANAGGGIFNSATLNLRNSMVSGNTGGGVHGLYYSQSEVFDITGSSLASTRHSCATLTRGTTASGERKTMITAICV